MHRPVAGNFEGSMPVEHIDEGGLDLQHLAAAISVILASGTAVLIHHLSTGPQYWVAPLVLGSIVLIVGCVLGNFIIETSDGLQQRFCRAFQNALSNALDEGGPVAVQHAPSGSPVANLAGLVATTVRSLRRLHARSEKIDLQHAQARAAMQAGRREGRNLVDELTTDSAMLDTISARIEASEQRLDVEIADVSRACQFSEEAMARAALGTIALTQSVRATTLETERMTVTAIHLSEVAMKTQKTVTALAERPERVNTAMEQVACTLRTARALAQAASAASFTAGASGGDVRALAEQLCRTIASCASAVEAANGMTAELREEAAAARLRIEEMSAVVQANHERGGALCETVMVQSEQIAVVLNRLNESRLGFATLRSSVDAVMRREPAQGQQGATVGDIARALPSRTSRLTAILRDLPDFAKLGE